MLRQPNRPSFRRPAAHDSADRLSHSGSADPFLTESVLLGAAKKREACQVDVAETELLDRTLHPVPWWKCEQSEAGEKEQDEKSRKATLHPRSQPE